MESVIMCPHCGESILIEKLNCGIFRHGVIKETGKQVDPHASKTVCDELVAKNLIYGCGKPFQILVREGQYIVLLCDYI